jgi:hypothetical protein
MQVTGDRTEGLVPRRPQDDSHSCASCTLCDLFSIFFNEARRSIVDNAFLDLASRILGNADVLWI